MFFLPIQSEQRQNGVRVEAFTRGELGGSRWGSCDNWRSCRFNSSRVGNTCHNSFPPQLSKLWLLHAEMSCAIKANLSLYSCVHPAMFNQPRALRAPSRRGESRAASIRQRSEGRRFQPQRLIQYENPNAEPTVARRLIPDTLKCSFEMIVNKASGLSGGPTRNPIWQKRKKRKKYQKLSLKSACPWDKKKMSASVFLLVMWNKKL